MDLKTASIEQLKALAYDQLVLREQCQKNLEIINQELAGRQTGDKPQTKEPKTK